MGPELIVALLAVSLDGRVIEGAVGPLDLAARRWVVWLCETLLGGRPPRLIEVKTGRTVLR